MTMRDERVFGALLHLYPRAFRERYGDAMLDFYRDQRRAAIRAGVSPWRAFFASASNLAFTASLERLSSLRVRRRAHALTDRPELPMLETVRQDIRYAWRSLRRVPVFTTTVVATLALAIGANVSIFAVLNGVLLRPDPYPDPEQIVFASFQRGGALSEPEFLDYRRDLKSVASVAVYAPAEANLTGEQEPERLSIARVSGDFFRVFGLAPHLGRSLTPADDDPAAPAVVVISHGLWTRRFGSDSTIVNKPMLINGRPYTVIGVMPSAFAFPGRATAAWTPLRINAASPLTRANHYLRTIARLAPTATPQTLIAEIGTMTERWRRDYPDGYSQTEPYTPVVESIHDRAVGSSRPYLLALGGAVGFVLLVACANVANLALVRAESRQREIAIRSALGADRGRLVRQLFTESAMLTAAGTVVGLGVAWLCTKILIHFAEGSIPRLGHVQFDATLLAFSVGVSAITAILFGVAPALRSSRHGSAQMLRDTAKTTARGSATRTTRQALAIAEVAVAMLVLSGAGLLVKSLIHLQSTDIGFVPERVLAARIALPRGQYSRDKIPAFFGELTTRLASQAGVVAAGGMEWTPMGGLVPDWGMLRDGIVTTLPNAAPAGSPLQVTPGYFEAMGIQIVRGRGIQRSDDATGAAVVVVSQSLAKRFWPDQDPIGRTIRVFRDDAAWATVVGVARDTRMRDLEHAPTPMMYFPVAQAERSTYGLTQAMTIAVRTTADPTVMTTQLRRIVRELDKDIPVSDLSTMETIVRGSIATRRFGTTVLAAFAGIAVLLAAIGIYGVISYGVSQRTYELGIRMALGADRRRVLSLILGEGVRMAITGIVIGVVAALLGGRLLRVMLVGVQPRDVGTLLVVSIVLLIVAILAAALPARRATSVSPTQALRGG